MTRRILLAACLLLLVVVVLVLVMARAVEPSAEMADLASPVRPGAREPVAPHPPRPGEDLEAPRSRNPLSCGDDADKAFSVSEALGRQACAEDLAAASCEPPVPFDQPSLAPEPMLAVAEAMLSGCNLRADDVAVDCTEFPCLLFVASDAPDDPGCKVTQYFKERRRAAGGAEPQNGQRSWENSSLVHPRDRDAALDQRAFSRWTERMRRTSPWLDEPRSDQEGIAMMPVDCDARNAVLDAPDDAAFCAALLDAWGCDEPDHEAHARRLAAAERTLERRLDPECATFERDQVLLDCSAEPCTFSYLKDSLVGEVLYCDLGEVTVQVNRLTDLGMLSTIPLWPEDPEERAALEEVFQKEQLFRSMRAGELLAAGIEEE